jgi:hypothetical protein
MTVPLQTLSFERNRGGATRLLVGAAVLALLAAWFATRDAAWLAEHTRFDSLGSLYLVAGALLLAGAACGVLALRCRADRSPGLVLDAEGLVDGVSSARAGRIRWSEVQGLAVLNVRHQFTLVVRLAEPQKYINAAPALQRPLAEADFRLCGSAVVFADGRLQTDFEALVKTFHAYYAQYGQAAAGAGATAV